MVAVDGGGQASGIHGPLDLDPAPLPPYQASGIHGPLDLDPVSDGAATAGGGGSRPSGIHGPLDLDPVSDVVVVVADDERENTMVNLKVRMPSGETFPVSIGLDEMGE